MTFQHLMEMYHRVFGGIVFWRQRFYSSQRLFIIHYPFFIKTGCQHLMRLPESEFSLTTRAGFLLAAIIFISMTGMLSTLFIVENIDGDAARINIAGSLRMYTIRISRAYLENHIAIANPQDKNILKKEIDEFERQLQNPLLHSSTMRNNDVLSRKMDLITKRWADIKSTLEQQTAPEKALYLLDQFVTEIDHFVTLTQQMSESQVRLLRTLQSAGLLLTLILSVLILIDLYKRIVLPLRELVMAAKQAENGDFKHRIKYDNQDELGQLAHAFNTMSVKLDIAWKDFEQRVEQKTQDLQNKNAALELLYQANQALSEKPDDMMVIEEIITQLEETTGLQSVRLCLEQINNDHLIPVTTLGMPSPKHCERIECEHCVQRINLPAELVQHFTIKGDDCSYGVLTIEPRLGHDIELWQVQLVETLVDNFGRAFSLRHKNEQANRLMLLEERNAIARELHDSLAQSLSYLRFQVTRFQLQLQKDMAKETLFTTSEELQTGLGNAYQQLRELLTTFRLKIDEPGLEQALKGTIAEFSQRGNLNIHLDYGIKSIIPTANEEIHLLQIIREALSNVLKHAQASEVDVRFQHVEANSIHVTIEDNGKGLPKNRTRMNHHGLAIL